MMGNSLFRKLFLMYAGVLTAVVVVLSLILSVLYTGRMYEEKRLSLTSTGKMANRAMGEYLDGLIDKERLSQSIDMIGYIADARIYAIRYDSDSLSSMAEQLADESQADDGLMADMAAILKGETVFHTRAYSAKLDTNVVLAGFPMTQGENILGGILIYAPLDRVTRDVWQMNYVVFGIAICALLIGTLLLLQLTGKILQPIRDMQRAAGRLASGEGTEPIPILSQDEIGRLAKAFNHMQEQLMKTEEVRRGFIANVSHELRTPLTSIRGFLQGMLDGVIRQDAFREYLLLMMDEVMRLNKLTGEILDLAKLQSGSQPLIKEQTDMRILAVETLASLKGLLGERSLQVEVEEGESVFAYVDPDRMRQVLVNLVGNAIKFTPDGGRIGVSVSRDGSKIVLDVHDTGIGIPEEELPLIFDKFHRVDKSGNPTYGGSGLGLNIAKTIVELHRGEIIASILVKGGTAFTIRLPEN